MDKKQELAKAFDTGSASSALVHLNLEQANAFIDTIVDESQLLKKARVHKMTKPTAEIAKLAFNGRFLNPGAIGTVQSDNERAEATTSTITLESKIVKGKFIVFDEEREDVTQGNLDTYLLSLIAKKTANEIEMASMIGRKVASPANIDGMFDGFLYRAITGGNVVDAADTGIFADRYVAKAKFSKAMKALPTRFRANAEYFVPSDVMIDYTDLYDTVADANVRAQLQGAIMRRPVTEIPLLECQFPVLKTGGCSTTLTAGVAAGVSIVPVAATTNLSVGDEICLNFGDADEQVRTVTAINTLNITLNAPLTYAVSSGDTFKEVTTDGAVSLLTNPQNLIYGIQKDFTFESERIANVGTQYHFKARLDFQIEELTALSLVRNMLIK